MLPIFGTKELDDLDESDLQDLKNKQIPENRFVEYKRDMYGGTDSQVEEMLADITAFANSQGGYLFIGIEEMSRDNPIPNNILGIDNAEVEAQRIRDRCEACVDEYIQGLKVKTVSLSNGKKVIIVCIPNSPKKPHMVTFKNKNRFYIRRDEGKSLMNVEEIRDVVLRVEEYMEKLEKFLEKRKRDVKEEIVEKFNSGCWMILSSCPIFVSEERIDVAKSGEIKELIINSPLEPTLNQKVNYTIKSGLPKITLHGLRSEKLNRYNRHGEGQYLEVWNEGYIEFGFSLEEFSKTKLTEKGYASDETTLRTYLIPNLITPDIVISFCYFVHDVIKIMRINEPIVFKLILLNCLSITLEYTGDEIVFWQQPEFIINPIKVYTPEKPSIIAKELMTKIFRAFGRLEPKYTDRSGRHRPLFDEDGNYKPD